MRYERCTRGAQLAQLKGEEIAWIAPDRLACGARVARLQVEENVWTAPVIFNPNAAGYKDSEPDRIGLQGPRISYEVRGLLLGGIGPPGRGGCHRERINCLRWYRGGHRPGTIGTSACPWLRSLLRNALLPA